jgi:hypothetical protein
MRSSTRPPPPPSKAFHTFRTLNTNHETENGPRCDYCHGTLTPQLSDFYPEDGNFQLDFCCERAGLEWQDALAELPRAAWRELFARQLGDTVRGVVPSHSGALVVDHGLRFEEIDRKSANNFIRLHHRHNRPVQGDIFRFAIWNGNVMLGVTTVGRPVAREIDQKRVVEITRVCVRNDLDAPGLKRRACSEMYREAARRAAKLLKARIITYTLVTEEGTSLEIAGLRAIYETAAHKTGWNAPSRPRNEEATPAGTKICWERRLVKEGLNDLNARAREWRITGRKPLYGQARKRQHELFPQGEEADGRDGYLVESDCPHLVCYATG